MKIKFKKSNNINGPIKSECLLVNKYFNRFCRCEFKRHTRSIRDQDVRCENMARDLGRFSLLSLKNEVRNLGSNIYTDLNVVQSS